MALCARTAQMKAGVKKILIMDWDAHHGQVGQGTTNHDQEIKSIKSPQGTQREFYEDDSVLYVSIHRCSRNIFYFEILFSNY